MYKIIDIHEEDAFFDSKPELLGMECIFEKEPSIIPNYYRGYFYVPGFSVKPLYFYAVKVEKV